jgi:hypothetical protein
LFTHVALPLPLVPWHSTLRKKKRTAFNA